jgi:transketolase
MMANESASKAAVSQVAGAQLEQQAINTIRFLSVDAVEKANSGHPGLPMGAAAMAYTLWMRYMRYNPTDPQWFDRDRFILSAGHGSMLLYSLLYLTGYDLPLEQIKQFRQWGSITPGHPEKGLTPGVETTTGPLGQGFANGVGMAIAEAHLAAVFNRPGFEIIRHYTYALVSDGDLMEGVASEAASLAGHLRLGRLIYLYDNNHVSLAASTSLDFSEDVAQRFQAYGWQTIAVEDGNDTEAIGQAIEQAQAEHDRPTLILARTHLGYGAPNLQDTFKAHGSPLGAEETAAAKKQLGWPTEPVFYIPDEALKHFRQAVDRGKQAQADWQTRFEDYRRRYPELAAQLASVMRNELPAGWDADIPTFPADAKGLATRASAGKTLSAIAPHLFSLMGGSADLDPSTDTALKGLGDFENPGFQPADRQGTSGGEWSYAGRNVHFGVREHAMGSAVNGLAAHGGVIPFSATFLIFSDYMRPAIRLAALMEIQSIFVFTHDSIGLGEDGPTHQSVEQLASLRAIPHLLVIRPGDANEAAEAWRVAISTRNRPSALIFSRQAMPTFDRGPGKLASADGLRRGGYVLADADGGRPDIILIGTGSELHLCVEAAEQLRGQGVRARVVSMPCWQLFDDQSAEYRESVLPAAVWARVSVEAGSPLGWRQYVGDRGEVIGVNRFGASAPGGVVMAHYGFTVENIVQRGRMLINK